LNANLKAFLDTIAHSEGTKDIGDDGYNVIVGSRPMQAITFSSYHDHPRITVRIRKDNPSTPFDEELLSSAAGRYQILIRYFDAYKKSLNLPDFSPTSQDAIALQLIRECNALDDVLEGRFEKAIDKCKSRWASLPGAGYNQHENTLLALRTAFINFGGSLS
jgi:muramidase (phage lysozyme)